MTESEHGKPVVEPIPAQSARGSEFDELYFRIRQQELLAEIGVKALQGDALENLLNSAVRVAAEGVNAQFSKIVRRLPGQNVFLVLAGYGWKEDVVGTTLTADTASPAGFAIATGRPVISNHLEYEGQFRTPKMLMAHGVRRAINVILQGQDSPFGILEVDSTDPGEFNEHDLAFLQGLANLVGIAIERRHYEEQLNASLEHQQALLKEVNHRVKNSLQLVSSMLRLQAATAGEAVVKRHLNDAQGRVMAIARAHERLYQTPDITHLDITNYLTEVCTELDGGIVRCEGPSGIFIETDRAIPLALLVSELVTNSLKYAYPFGQNGPVWVKIAPLPEEKLQVSVADEGIGLRVDFDPDSAKGLGMTLVASFAQRIHATIDFRSRNPGTEVVLVFPRQENGSS